MLKLKRYVLIALALGVLAPAASAQVLPMDPYRLPATDLIELFTSGVNHTAVVIAFQECPSQSERHDSVFTGIAELQLSEQSSIWLATMWGAATQLCDEPRLIAWFRRQFERFPSPATRTFFVKRILRQPGAADIAFVRNWLATAQLDDYHMTEGLRALGAATPIDGRLTTIHELGAHVRLPEEFLSMELYFLRRAGGDQVRRGLLAAAVHAPAGPTTERLLEFLWSDLIDNRPSDAWRQDARPGLEQLIATGPPDIRSWAALLLRTLEV